MDRLVYTAMTGAKHIMDQQATVSNNLANATTSGFRAQLDSFRAVPVLGDGLPTRAFVVSATVGSDFSPGTLEQTGRSLDVAVENRGWLAVATADGGEGYTRSGSLQVNENGLLLGSNGLPVVSDGGNITVPPNSRVTIGNDGTVSAISSDQAGGAPNVLGRLKLVNPPEQDLVRGPDGLFRLKSGEPAPVDPNVKVLGGSLEGSNVNVVESMVEMINLARQFETNMSLMRNAENNAAKASQILALN